MSQEFAMRIFALSSLTLAALACAPAHAAEAYIGYDGFNAASGALNPGLWNQLEIGREVKSGFAVLRQRNLGQQISNSGTWSIIHSLPFDEPWRITQMKADITVMSASATACAANTSPTEANARLTGAFFNSGAPTPGNATGDIGAQIRVVQRSDSTAPLGTLQVEGLAYRCTNADCTSSVLVGSLQNMGTVAVGSMVRAQVEWDQPNKRFLLTRDSNPAVSIAYTDSDSAGPGNPVKSLSLRQLLANCFSGPRTQADLEARFDNVAVNASGTP
ncbi:MAG: hypothetical protein C4K60_19530 [Ideonella sp. MAG2]|nr:MAG: hypothetical protein C4K60_19530 [Ideonella sp. MAG2]